MHGCEKDSLETDVLRAAIKEQEKSERQSD